MPDVGGCTAGTGQCRVLAGSAAVLSSACARCPGHLRSVCKAQVVEQKWAARHEREGQAVHDMLLDQSGLYVKSAQILASKRDFMPEPWCRRLAAMFDSMPPRPWSHVARVCDHTVRSRCFSNRNAPALVQDDTA